MPVCFIMCRFIVLCCCYLVFKSCPTLHNPMDYSPAGSSVHGILQARIVEWVAISFSRGSFWPRDWTCVSCIGRQILYYWATFICQLNCLIFSQALSPRKKNHTCAGYTGIVRYHLQWVSKGPSEIVPVKRWAQSQANVHIEQIDSTILSFTAFITTAFFKLLILFWHLASQLTIW